MSWEPEVKELERRRYLAQQQGGEESIAKQHARGRLTIRERVDAVLDKGSFREHGRATASPVYNDKGEIMEYAPANYLVGFGKVDQIVAMNHRRRGNHRTNEQQFFGHMFDHSCTCLIESIRTCCGGLQNINVFHHLLNTKCNSSLTDFFHFNFGCHRFNSITLLCK